MKTIFFLSLLVAPSIALSATFDCTAPRTPFVLEAIVLGVTDEQRHILIQICNEQESALRAEIEKGEAEGASSAELRSKRRAKAYAGRHATYFLLMNRCAVENQRETNPDLRQPCS